MIKMPLQNPAADKFHLAGLLYCSQATELMSSADLQKISKISQLSNPRRGITGLLVHSDGMFMQWLEGPRYEVRKLMATVALDPRHEAVVRLHKMVDLNHRVYPSWAMQTVQPDAIRDSFRSCLNVIGSHEDRMLISEMIKVLEIGEHGMGLPRTAVKPPTDVSLRRTNLSSKVRNWFHRSSKSIADSRMFTIP